MSDSANDNASNVIYPDFITRLDIPAERVLKSALDANLKRVVVLAYDENDNEYFASSIADGADVNWLLDRCKKRLLDMG